jgi:predicted RNA-binding protein YlqC (UPF0109 family)
MKEFVEFMAKHLVDAPDAVVVEQEEQEEGKIVFKLRVAQNDIGKIIGKSGKTAGAMRILLRAIAAKEGKKALLEIVD